MRCLSREEVQAFLCQRAVSSRDLPLLAPDLKSFGEGAFTGLEICPSAGGRREEGSLMSADSTPG